MSDNDILRLVKSIQDGEDATITLSDGGNRKTFDCIYRESLPPSFCLLFAPEDIPDKIAPAKQCPFTSIDAEGQTVSFAAEFVSKRNARVFEFVAKKSIKLEDFRDYFRINITIPIKVSYTPLHNDGHEQALTLRGETVDISQSGVLAILSDKCAVCKNIEIEFTLPAPRQTIFCIGHVVRIKRLRKNRYLTALCFDQLSHRDKDIIAMNCFAEQRRQLRENIQVA